MTGLAMNRNKLESMSIDELWELHKDVSAVLAKRIKNKIHKLENISEALAGASDLQPCEVAKRRPYPKVPPKFQNPEHPEQTWAGRGKQPQWVIELVRAGRNIEDFRISRASRAA
jgi:DNA-binding protein H-NS